MSHKKVTVSNVAHIENNENDTHRILNITYKEINLSIIIMFNINNVNLMIIVNA